MNQIYQSSNLSYFSRFLIPSERTHLFFTVMPIISELQLLFLTILTHIKALHPLVHDQSLFQFFLNLFSEATLIGDTYSKTMGYASILIAISLIALILCLTSALIHFRFKRQIPSIAFWTKVALVIERDLICCVMLGLCSRSLSNPTQYPFLGQSANWLAIFLIVFSIIFGILGAMFCFCPFRSEYIFSSRNSIHIQIGILMKICLSLMLYLEDRPFNRFNFDRMLGLL